MTEKAPRPFRSSVTNFDDLRKRMDELGIRPIIGIRPVIGNVNGVDVEPPKEPEKPADGYLSVSVILETRW